MKTQKTVAEIFEESRKAFKVAENEKKLKSQVLAIGLGFIMSIGALGLAFVVAMVPAWATLWSTNTLGVTSYEINLGTVFAAAWLMSCAGFVLWRLRGGK